MRVTRVHVRGFKRFREVTVDSDHDRLLVVGANEAGKSTLLEAIVAGLFGLAPGRHGRGHQGALKDVEPWGGGPCGLSLTVRLDDDRVVEADWDFSGERTRVVDHGSGEDISATFEGGTHGWVDVGQSLTSLPDNVFRQFTCVGEGALAVISDDVEIRESLLRLTDSGVDVLVEQAIGRLGEGARQAAVPKVNAATRRNQLERQRATAETELARATEARRVLEAEVDAIVKTEVELRQFREQTASMVAERDRQGVIQREVGSEIDRARGRLAEAELRLASLLADEGDEEAEAPAWSPAEIEAARGVLAAPDEPQRRRSPLLLAIGIAVVLAGVAVLAAGVLAGYTLVTAVGAVLIGLGVFAVTGGRGGRRAELTVGEVKYPSRQALMTALDQQRVRLELAAQQKAVEELQRKLQFLLRPVDAEPDAAATSVDPFATAEDGASAEQLDELVTRAFEREQELILQLERQRTELQVRTSQVPEVAPLEELVASLHAKIEELDAFGAACRLAADQLSQASEEIRRAYAPKLQQYLSRDLPRITAGRYSEAVVSERFEVMLRAPETKSMVEMSRLSRGTQQQVYLLLRLGLLDIVGAKGERLPLFLDDALALSDDERRAELLKVLEAEHRQVIYFTAREEAAAAMFGKEWHRIELPAPSADGKRVPNLKIVEAPSG